MPSMRKTLLVAALAAALPLPVLAEDGPGGQLPGDPAKAADPAIPGALDDPGRLSEILRDRNREEALLKSVEQTAEGYRLDAAIARKVFRWVIEETLALEVAYLQRVGREAH